MALELSASTECPFSGTVSAENTASEDEEPAMRKSSRLSCVIRSKGTVPSLVDEHLQREIHQQVCRLVRKEVVDATAQLRLEIAELQQQMSQRTNLQDFVQQKIDAVQGDCQATVDQALSRHHEFIQEQNHELREEFRELTSSGTKQDLQISAIDELAKTLREEMKAQPIERAAEFSVLQELRGKVDAALVQMDRMSTEQQRNCIIGRTSDPLGRTSDLQSHFAVDYSSVASRHVSRIRMPPDTVFVARPVRVCRSPSPVAVQAARTPSTPFPPSPMLASSVSASNLKLRYAPKYINTPVLGGRDSMKGRAPQI